MTLRIIAFMLLLLLMVIGVVRWFHLPFDIFLTFVLALLGSIIALFAHYRFIGRLRSSDRISRALVHLAFWRPLLPREVYFQLQTQLVIESGDDEAAKKAIDRADQNGLDPVYLSGLLADLDRRQNRALKAEQVLLHSLETTPPGVLRTGLLCQLVRLYALDLPSPKHFKTSEELLDEAEEYVSNDAHKGLLQAIRGELAAAQNKHEEAVEQLQAGLKTLLHIDEEEKKNAGFFARLKRLIAQMTYTEHDEHQYPLFAEFQLALGDAWKAQGDKENARIAYEYGLQLCKQPFVAKQLQKALSRL
jgi:hypothetical protein